MSDNALNWGLNIAVGLVLLGVTLEGSEFVEEVRKDGWQFRNCLKLVAKLGFALLVLGLGGEWYFSTAIHDRDADRISGQQSKIIDLSAKLLAAEKQAANRDLTAEQIKAVALAVSRFAGERVQVVTDMSVFEQAYLGGRIAAALSMAHWQVLWPPPQSFLEDGPPLTFQGVGVMATPDKESQEAAKALYDALPDDIKGAFLPGAPGATMSHPSDKHVRVVVGGKKAPLSSWVHP